MHFNKFVDCLSIKRKRLALVLTLPKLPLQSEIAKIFEKKMAAKNKKLLWGTANMFSNRRFMAGAATNPDPDVFAYCAAQVKHCMDVTKDLDGAIALLEDFTAKNPKRPGALILLANTYEQKGDLDKAAATERWKITEVLPPDAENEGPRLTVAWTRFSGLLTGDMGRSYVYAEPDWLLYRPDWWQIQ
jgi:tetratricopeptide (TPR) repeat protein